MTQPYGIDTSVLVRLATAEPEGDFQHCVSELRSLIEEQVAEIFASNQVIGEAYIVLQHHYGISPADARSSLEDVLTSGMVAPLNGQSVIRALRASVKAPRSWPNSSDSARLSGSAEQFTSTNACSARGPR